MDIKKILLEMINSDVISNNAYREIEKLIYIMFQDYLQRQNKQILQPSYTDLMPYDMLLPNGIDNISGKVAVEIKMFRNRYIRLDRIYDAVGRIAIHGKDIDALLLIIVNEISEDFINKIRERDNHLGYKLFIWNIDDLVKIFEANRELFAEAYHNLNKELLNDTISRGIARKNKDYLETQKKYIVQLKEEYKNDNIVLFLGAGTSIDANIATWDTLILELFVSLIDKKLKEQSVQIEKSERENILKEIIRQNGNSPLLQTRFLRKGFQDEFEELVSKILYKNAVETSDLLEEIGQLCVPNRGKLGVKAIVNYNFDDLVEKNLKRLRVSYHSIYGEGMTPKLNELGIYHVHGFLPQHKEEYSNLAKSLLVFSEEGYHKLMIEPYNWANMLQLNYMVNNTCVFIGLSMTDPNMRRLLEIAAQKRDVENLECKHYAIMKKFCIEGSETSDAIKSFEGVNESIQESLFQEIGVNVIWIKKYEEIPTILRQIKEN